MTASRARRPGQTVRTRVVEHDGERERRHEDRLATEEPLEIRIAPALAPAARVWLTMRTPGHDFELAAGWVVNEGLAPPDAIETVAYCTDHGLSPQQEHNVVTLRLTHISQVPRRHAGHSAGSSACGVCGKDSIAAVLDTRPGVPWAGPRPTADVVRRLPQALSDRQTVFDLTGGVHAAALATSEGEILLAREDVGRHNAVDKVVGARVLAGQPPGEACLVVSGRAGFELVQKAVSAGMGSLVAVGAPTSLSVDLARSAGLELWGFTSPGRTVRYA